MLTKLHDLSTLKGETGYDVVQESGVNNGWSALIELELERYGVRE